MFQDLAYVVLSLKELFIYVPLEESKSFDVDQELFEAKDKKLLKYGFRTVMVHETLYCKLKRGWYTVENRGSDNCVVVLALWCGEGE